MPNPTHPSPSLLDALVAALLRRQQADATSTRGTQRDALVQQTVDQMRQLDPDSVEAAGRTMALAHQRGYSTPNWSAYNPLSYVGISGPQRDQMYPATRTPPPLPFTRPAGR